MSYYIGNSASFSKTIGQTDVYMFAGICGDFNEIHINKVAAERSRFKKQICHGMLVSSLISTVIGMQLPGPGSIYLEQDLKFVKPVFIDDTVTATVTIKDIRDSRIYTLDTVVTNQDGICVVTGTAKVLYEGKNDEI